MASVLFEGKANPFGGLTNERELLKECPAQFKKDNAWSDYASRAFFNGADMTNWKFKSDDESTQKLQLMCFRSLLGGWGLKHEEKEALAGWMLSEMLTELPKYIAPKKK